MKEMITLTQTIRPIHYIITGILDSPQNKYLLHDCSNLHEFKQQLKIYEEMRCYTKNDFSKNINDFQNMKLKQQNVERFVPKDKNVSPLHCFSCIDLGHKFNDCPTIEKGIKCFACNF